MDDQGTELAVESGTLDENQRDDEFRDAFLGILGHDLRNPLAAILTSARLALRRGALPPSDQKTIARIVSSGERMERMISEILDVTRSRQRGGIPLRSETADLSEIVTAAVDAARRQYVDAVIELSFKPEGRFAAQVDATRIEQVLSALLANAIRRSPAGGAVRVALRSDAVYVTASIHDDGLPIAHDLQASFFDPFARAESARDRSSGALGLSLYIADRLVRAHGGAIHLASSTEDGTTLEFSVARALIGRGTPR